MKGFSKAIALGALAVSLRTSAHAAELITADVGAFGNDVYCNAVNTKTKPITVTVEAKDMFDQVIGSQQVTLQPDQGISLGPNQFADYCKFTAPSKRNLVAMALVVDHTTGDYTTCLPAE